MYFLPEDLIVQCPTLRSLPRKVREIMYFDDMTAVVNSDQFFGEIMDAVAFMVFPHFGLRGWKEHYTGYCPVWQLTYVIGLWAQQLEKEIGWNLQALLNIPRHQEIPFFQPEYIEQVMGKVVRNGIEEQGWQPILDAVKEMPCDQDFEKWDTNVRKDFLRKWYHTRSKRVQQVSLEACIEDAASDFHKITDASTGFEESVIAEDYCQRFKERLTQRDIEIFELRTEGFTYEEIAERMGYSNHRGVLKRIKAITTAFQKYEDEQ